MSVPRYVQVGVVALSIVSWFWLPWIISAVLLFFAGLALPAAAFGIGVLADLLYYPGHGLPLGTVLGLILGVFAALVRYFVKTRII